MSFVLAHAPHDTDFAFHVVTRLPSWADWHRCFGHVSYSGLQRLYDKRVVQISIVDANSSGSTLRSRISFFFGRSFAWNGTLSRSILWLVNLSFPSFPPIDKDEAFAVLLDDDCHSLSQARRSPEWPQWKQAIQSELAQLQRMGTWKLVDKPPHVTPIGNKFVFAKKRDNEGNILKYKARLVAKGCAQRPGYDFIDTHSPVVRLESIRTILAIAPTRKLHIHQLDVKGAYLNGTLKEKVYMKQPEGYGDSTPRVCLLIKTLYGLKQAGREWNLEFDRKLRK